VCGTIDIEKALSEGVKAFEPGLLAKANRGILYVDEVGSERTLCCIAQTVLHHAARDALLCICIPDMHRG
jgi:Mg-chelatase subunit ChlI